ncbi:MAG: glycoside-pentoside-hexuronide (GPH):cation symporter [Paraglaciecola sp.]|uniref:glycoside-pentoside-hexuronide (GPH):cation symporter n=1 Tax=Paraglaciecola sp. TaxID=1920173 RepID=UPI00273D81D1|nr:glycoside-pentoside-hexuronide (GPH):cation symporter [Paraglaciecola sp.]MDP5032319.1 glycoside-pentoside-hexuronide (GPH):cation symporter [Paraglaciecola sp.]MDP5134234.1 glycoside-pentoside-hexuronide (GPH):cation symporter [Paraglaciecola sp.]
MLHTREKIAYGLGDTASNIVFQTVMLFLSFFYTDIFGISPAIVGTMFLAVRILDAVTDPLMGAITDRTQSRHGKFRPYLLWLCVPFAAISVLAFTTPDLSMQGKIIYAFVTYSLLMIAYTAINIPYSALGAVMTSDPGERVSLQSYRFVCAMLGGLLVTSLTLPLVDWFGAGDKAKGYQLTIGAMSILGIGLFLLCFFGTKERVIAPSDVKTTLKQDFKSLLKNDQWRVLCGAALFLLIGMVLRSTLAIYYVKYYLQREELITAFITLGMIGNIVGCLCSPYIARKIGKVKAYIGLQVVAAIISMLSYFIGAEQLFLAFIAYFLWSFFIQMATPLLWAKMADTVDYGQWLTGIRITGIVYSSVVFFIKLGLALGGAFAGWLLAFYGYEAGAEQSDSVKQGIVFSFAIYPGIASLLVAFIMRYYRLTETKVSNIQKELSKVT